MLLIKFFIRRFADKAIGRHSLFLLIIKNRSCDQLEGILAVRLQLKVEENVSDKNVLWGNLRISQHFLDVCFPPTAPLL